jgi:hypothetical protein
MTTRAQALRGLVRSGLLRHTDLRDRPERFFKARGATRTIHQQLGKRPLRLLACAASSGEVGDACFLTPTARARQAHRLLARHAVAQGPGFWIRFTVHYNVRAPSPRAPDPSPFPCRALATRSARPKRPAHAPT